MTWTPKLRICPSLVRRPFERYPDVVAPSLCTLALFPSGGVAARRVLLARDRLRGCSRTIPFREKRVNVSSGVEQPTLRRPSRAGMKSLHPPKIRGFHHPFPGPALVSGAVVPVEKMLANELCIGVEDDQVRQLAGSYRPLIFQAHQSSRCAG